METEEITKGERSEHIWKTNKQTKKMIYVIDYKVKISYILSVFWSFVSSTLKVFKIFINLPSEIQDMVDS